MIQEFLVDYNGEYYVVAVETNNSLEEVQSFLEEYSNDVRFWNTVETRRRNDKGNRKVSCGIICNCRYFGSKIGHNTKFTERKLGRIQRTPLDRRHILFG